MDAFETTIYTAVLITAIVLAAVISYFAVTIFRNQRRHFRMLTRQFMAEMELLETERNRIARDLHDELGPLLTVTNIHLQATKGIDEEDSYHLDKASEHIVQLHERFRNIALNLTPKTLLVKGLDIALSDLLGHYSLITPIHFDYRYTVKTNPGTSTALHIYRIIQEMLHNTIRHSCATSVILLLHQEKNRLYLLFKDDGIGLDRPSHSNTGTGLGLTNLKNRAQMLHGKISCMTQADKGTEFFFEIPITASYEK
jgi:signal transduction histidine kinase